MLRYQIRAFHKYKENKDVMVNSMEQLKLEYNCNSSTTCYRKNRNVPRFFFSRNCQPVWYKHEDDGSYALDAIGNMIVHYNIPDELTDPCQNNSLSYDTHHISLRFIHKT